MDDVVPELPCGCPCCGSDPELLLESVGKPAELPWTLLALDRSERFECLSRSPVQVVSVSTLSFASRTPVFLELPMLLGSFCARSWTDLPSGVFLCILGFGLCSQRALSRSVLCVWGGV